MVTSGAQKTFVGFHLEFGNPEQQAGNGVIPYKK
jgi:hypothetical protein